VEALRGALDAWLAHGQVPAADELRTMVARLPALGVGARASFHGDEQPLPDYVALVDAHNARRRSV
jgi:hypothetical protein